ncbi:hypothetical protein K1719_042165 [Acacia pycnantha]|nr:hypothetical protein K1719_042165 [Acacia pycnantha]
MQFAKLGDSPMFRKQHDANSAALGKYFQVGDTNESFAYSFIEEGSGTYVGKPILNFLQTKFTIYDGQTPHKGTKTTKSRSVKCENLNQVFTQGIVTTKIFKDRIFMKGTQTGNGSTLGKKNIIVNRMCSCREMEIKYLARIRPRIYETIAMIRTVLPALAQVVINS